MSAPVAGRRKGLNLASPSSAGASLPATQKASIPSWLADVGDSTTPPAPPAVVHEPPGSREAHSSISAAPFRVAAGTPTGRESPAIAVAVAPVTEEDPLAFLNESDATSSPTSPQRLKVACRSTQDKRLAANDVGSHGHVVASSGSIALPPLTSSSPLPAFLREDGDHTPAAAPALLMAGAVSYEDTSNTTNVDAVTSYLVEEEGEPSQKTILRQQLSEIKRQLDDAAQRIDSLQQGRHPLAVEVSEVESTLLSLRSEEAAIRHQRAEEEAERQRAANLRAGSCVCVGSMEEEVREYRHQCFQHHQRQLDDLERAVQAQQTRNSTLRAELEAAVARNTKDDLEASVFESLLLRVRDGVHHIKRHLALQCSRTVSECARACLAAARQQRAEVFANDISARERTLAAHRARREAEASAFHDMCHRTYQERADAAFGSIKGAFDTVHRRHDTESRQRVAAFQCRLASMTQQSRDMLEQQVRQRLEQECTIAITQKNAFEKEWATRQEDLTAQLRAFRLRAERELCALRDSRAMPRTPVGFPSQMPTSTAQAQEVLLSDVNHVRVRMEQLALSLRIKQEQLAFSPYAQMATRAADRHSAGAAYASSHSLTSSSVAVEQISEGWQRSLLSLQHSREALRRSISDIKEVSHGWAAQLQQRRTQVTRQREDVRAIHAEWEQTIRRQLSRCLTATSSEVPAHAGLTTGSLENLNRRVGEILRSQQSLRATRATFTAELSTSLQSIGDYRVKTERLLADVFQQLDRLRERSVQTEVDQLTLKSLQAQVNVLEQHVTAEANRLTLRKRCLAAVAKNLPAGSSLSHTSQRSIDLQLLPPRREGGSTQVTQIFEDANSTTSIRDPAFPATAAALVSNAGREVEPTRQRAALRRAAAKNSQPFLTHKNACSVRASSLVTRASGLVSCGDHDWPKEAGRSTIAGIKLTAGTVMSGVNLFGSRSPSPIVAALEKKGGWVDDERDGSVGGAACVFVASAAHHTNDALDVRTAEAEDTDADSSAGVVPRGDVDENALHPLSVNTRR
ncbi:hypothetical protein JIQ42_00650 [Leishmania sp. Namibia]|uniref:hypothetical protein n=1 Tax=Leishmania sp. Namibia TaxID=2802991 RepID=UPI001B5FCD25|nr:hypothetical protein JIQ42_00650 [Leishmania sp. Namibia]